MAREPMIIRARVRARLLGIPLLALDAHITAASVGAPVTSDSAPVTSDSAPVLAIAVSRPAPPSAPPVRADLVPGDPGSSLAHARQLVEQGARVLDQGRHWR
jgi:hypothetical protein